MIAAQALVAELKAQRELAFDRSVGLSQELAKARDLVEVQAAEIYALKERIQEFEVAAVNREAPGDNSRSRRSAKD